MRLRLLDYGKLVEELHIIVFTKKSYGFREGSFARNIFLYPVNARTRWGYVPQAIRTGMKLKNSNVQIDAVTAQDPFEAGLVAYVVARILRARLHLQAHTDFMNPYFEKESLLNFLRVRLAKFLLKKANAVRVVSERIKKSLKGIIKPETPVEVLPIFVDSEYLANAPVNLNLKKKYPQFEKHILMASRLSVEKNISLAIDAMEEVVSKYPKTGLIIAGSGREERYLKSFVEKSKLAKSIFFEEWQNDIVSYYKTADLFLVTSNYEGYGMSAIEALSSGCPVVMTDVGCAGEDIRNAENGFVVPVGDKKALARAIIRIVSNGAHFSATPPKFPSKDEYLARYKKSWEDALL